MLRTPSATMFICSTISSSGRPRPSSKPTLRLRLFGLVHVATRSPSPARPANVIGSPPSATPSRVSSASPRVISAACVLSPYPSPAAVPDRDGDHVLHRAGDLAADDVGVRVHAEAPAHEELLQVARGVRRRAHAITDAAGCPSATSWRGSAR